jgi:hypothetical protein
METAGPDAENPDLARQSTPQIAAQILGLLAALWAGEARLARASWLTARRTIGFAVPALTMVLALLVVALGQASFALAAGLQAVGWSAPYAHMGAALILLALAGMVLWAVRLGYVRAETALLRVAQSLRADLRMLSNTLNRKGFSDDND